jgi:hypothetical protein
MSQFDNSNKGGIWKNDKRESETHPHFKGNAEVGGIDYWVSGWLRNKDGNPNAPAMKFSFTAKETQAHRQPPQQSTQMAQAKEAVMAGMDKGPHDAFDDDIPF